MLEIVIGVYVFSIFAALFYLGFTEGGRIYKQDVLPIFIVSLIWPFALPLGLGMFTKELVEKRKEKKHNELFL